MADNVFPDELITRNPTPALNVAGAVTASGSITAVQPTGTNLHTVVDSGSITATISGSVTSIPFAALSSATDGYLALTTTGDNALIAAPGGSTRIHVQSICASNTSSTDVRIDLKDGSTVKHSFQLAANGGGFSHLFPFPWRLTAATALNVAISANVTDVRVSATGFTST